MSRWGRWEQCLMVAVLLSVGLSACGGKGPAGDGDGTNGSGGGSAAIAALTRETLPTEPGVVWTVAHYSDSSPVAIDMKVEGPWTFTAQKNWRIDTNEIVETTGTPQISRFQDVDYVVKTRGDAGDNFYVRRVTDEWVLQLGEIQMRGDEAVPSVNATPTQFWPLDFKVGDSYLVSDTDAFRAQATVLARNTATVPAGTIENAYLLRFTYTPKTDAAKGGTYYYILAPNVGFVALIRPTKGDEDTGFTAAEQVDVLATLPRKR